MNIRFPQVREVAEPSTTARERALKWPVKGKINKYGFLHVSQAVGKALGLLLNPNAPPMFENDIPVEIGFDPKSRSLIVKPIYTDSG